MTRRALARNNPQKKTGGAVGRRPKTIELIRTSEVFPFPSACPAAVWAAPVAVGVEAAAADAPLAADAVVVVDALAAGAAALAAVAAGAAVPDPGAAAGAAVASVACAGRQLFADQRVGVPAPAAVRRADVPGPVASAYSAALVDVGARAADCHWEADCSAELTQADRYWAADSAAYCSAGLHSAVAYWGDRRWADGSPDSPEHCSADQRSQVAC